MSAVLELEAFLLSVEWRDTPRGLELTLWGASPQGPVRVTLTGQEAVMFVPRGVEARASRRVERPLHTKYGQLVDALYFKTQRALLDERDRLRAAGHPPLESDLKPTNRFLMERFIHGGVALRGVATKREGVLTFKDPTVRAADSTSARRRRGPRRGAPVDDRGGRAPGPGESIVFSAGDLSITRLDADAWTPSTIADPGE